MLGKCQLLICNLKKYIFPNKKKKEKETCCLQVLFCDFYLYSIYQTSLIWIPC